MIFDEQLDRGLFTAADLALLPPGALSVAKNARYKVGDPAIRRAEGRQVLSEGTSEHGRGTYIDGLVGIPWDPGAVSQAPEFMYSLGGYGTRWLFLPAMDDPSDAAMDAAGAVEVVVPSGVLRPRNVVPIENRFHVQTGGKQAVVYLNSSAQRTIRTVGLGTQSMKLRPVAASGGDLSIGSHWYWFTWYDSTTGVESGCASDFAAGGVVTINQAVLLNRGFILYALKTAFDAAKPSTADTIRVYKSLPALPNLAAGGLAEQYQLSANQWPNGYLYAEITISSLTTVVNIAESSDGSYPAGDYYLLTGVSQPGEDNDYLPTQPGFPLIDVGYLWERNGPPPNATCGDVFEGCAVSNDTANPHTMRYSIAYETDSWPSIYFVRFDGYDSDRVRAIKTLGNVCGVFEDRSLFRVNWLPQDGDVDFRQGKVYDLITATRGTLNEKTVVRFDMPGVGAMLASVDRTGLYATDLDRIIDLSNHLDWESMVDDPALIVGLLNNADMQRLELWVRNPSGVTGAKGWFFHYDQAHVKEGLLAVTGPIERPDGVSIVATVLTQGGKRVTVSGDGSYSTRLGYEGFGYTDMSGVVPVFAVTTREVYPGGAGQEVRTIYMHAMVAPTEVGTGELILNINGRLADKTQGKSSLAQTITERRLVQVPARLLAEAVTLELLTDSVEGLKVAFMGATFESLEDTKHE